MNRNFILKKGIFVYLCATVIYSTSAGLTASPKIRGFMDSLTVEVPIAGNTWKNTDGEAGGDIRDEGIVNWTDKAAGFTTYVRVTKPGMMDVWLSLKVPVGKSSIRLSAMGQTEVINVESSKLKDHYVGKWQITDTGYISFKISGIKKTGGKFADVSSIKLRGTAADKMNFIKNNKGNYFYWGRRGPSVHLSYPFAVGTQAEWFYNEVTVEKGMDVEGSYFMANGFAEGYFGMQVNSPTERRILFSVWSPFHTDDPKQIPDDQKIRLVAKGKDVYTGEFGNEGSGGQSFLRYNWKPGATYKFLLQGKPAENNYTQYTAYFYAPEQNKWLLIASFQRPKTNTYLQRLHSFLENFQPAQGNIERQVKFSNQWICDTNGKWTELVKARFTGDNTARKGYRMDYGGGTRGNFFYLRNCGFFNDYTDLNQIFERPLLGMQPKINFQELPQPGTL